MIACQKVCLFWQAVDRCEGLCPAEGALQMRSACSRHDGHATCQLQLRPPAAVISSLLKNDWHPHQACGNAMCLSLVPCLSLSMPGV